MFLPRDLQTSPALVNPSDELFADLGVDAKKYHGAHAACSSSHRINGALHCGYAYPVHRESWPIYAGLEAPR